MLIQLAEEEVACAISQRRKLLIQRARQERERKVAAPEDAPAASQGEATTASASAPPSVETRLSGRALEDLAWSCNEMVRQRRIMRREQFLGDALQARAELLVSLWRDVRDRGGPGAEVERCSLEARARSAVRFAQRHCSDMKDRLRFWRAAAQVDGPSPPLKPPAAADEAAGCTRSGVSADVGSGRAGRGAATCRRVATAGAAGAHGHAARRCSAGAAGSARIRVAARRSRPASGAAGDGGAKPSG